MIRPLNTHQIYYAKNFYVHSGDIIADMRKVCKLDMPKYDFSSPNQILKFMRKQYQLWLDTTPEVEKEIGGKVAWDDNPISAEMWSIIISYGVFIPMTQIHNYIVGLPRYDVMKPQYGASFGYGTYNYPFNKNMSTQELIDKTKEILNISNVDLIDMLADDCCQKYNYNKASKLLAEFGENITPEELDEELWDGYSNLVGLNLDDNGNLPEKYYHLCTKHFSIEIRPIFKPNSTFEFEVHLIPFRFEYTSDNVCTIENILDERVKCINAVIEQYKTSGAAAKITEACTKLYNEESEIWDVPQHLTGDEYTLIDEIKDCTNSTPEHWEYYHITPENLWKSFERSIDEYTPGGSSGGCFRTDTYNVNGHLKVAISLETIFNCAVLEGKLWNNQGMFISSPMY